MKTIGALIKAYRRSRGMTQIEMAEVMKTSQSQVSKYESGKLEPSLAEFRNLYKHAFWKTTGLHFNLSSWLRGEK